MGFNRANSLLSFRIINVDLQAESLECSKNIGQEGAGEYKCPHPVTILTLHSQELSTNCPGVRTWGQGLDNFRSPPFSFRIL